MLAAYLNKFGGPEVLEVGNLRAPGVADNEVRVAIRSSALNHLDIWVRKGLPGLKVEFPHILGGDASGLVEAVGKNVKDLFIGDEVIVHPGLSTAPWEEVESLASDYRILGEHVNGTNAEMVTVPRENIFPKPKNLSFDEAASVPLVFTTAWQMLVGRGQVKAGDLILVHAAASGVSSAAIQIAKCFGATVIATAGSPKKLDLASQLGADCVLDYSRQSVAAEIKKQFGKRGVDTVIDHVGADTWKSHFEVLRRGGKIITCGATSGFEVSLDLRYVFYKQIQILGSTMGSKGDFPRILRLLESGKLRAVVDRSFPLRDIQKAHAHLEGREALGKVIVSVS
ncbi:MAG: zinc-binding dehydrogenase [Bdellovibrionaceae bacterium]|nr:zinc-binding dehydrogenase [Bdellovibrionales bacterium]MCB9253863.1 zinc-binding dehydrogenase [Pseudobdellovibrionaceae bacterium]